MIASEILYIYRAGAQNTKMAFQAVLKRSRGRTESSIATTISLIKLTTGLVPERITEFMVQLHPQSPF